MSKHTPGPWSRFLLPGGSEYLIESETRELASVRGAGFDEGAANAQLTAAAPDLLAACEALQDSIEIGTCSVFEDDEGYPICNAIIEAMKKAKGE